MSTTKKTTTAASSSTEATSAATTTLSLATPLTLPRSGVTIRNRLAKAALTEGLATPDGIPTPALTRLYQMWAKQSGCGMLISGNIQVDRDHLERPGNVILQNGLLPIEEDTNNAVKQAYQEWTKAGTSNNTCFLAQISHGGRQVQKTIHPHPKAPSDVPLNLPGGKFGQPQALTVKEIDELMESFAQAAKTCQAVGFHGVQIHAAHGYLLSSFLNPRANIRPDDDPYGGSLEHRARVLLDIVRKTREYVGDEFIIAVKLNSADFQRGGFAFHDSLQVVQWLEGASVDMIEISGGNYEQGAMMNIGGMEEREEQIVDTMYKAESTKAREAYFLEFARAMQDVVTVPLMVTGGFRSKAAMDYALESGGADLIGLGRPLCCATMPNGPQQLLNRTLDELPRYENQLQLLPSWLSVLKRIKLLYVIDAFASQFWYYEQLDSWGKHGKAHTNLSPFGALLAVDARNRKLLSERTQGITVVKKKKSKNNSNDTNKFIMTMTIIGIAAVLVAMAVKYSMM